MLVLSMAAFLPSVLPGAAAEAATGAAVPVAGVLAFGIGAGQLGSSGGGSQSNSPTGVAFDGKGDLFAADPTNNRVVEYAPSSPTSSNGRSLARKLQRSPRAICRPARWGRRSRCCSRRSRIAGR